MANTKSGKPRKASAAKKTSSKPAEKKTKTAKAGGSGKAVHPGDALSNLKKEKQAQNGSFAGPPRLRLLERRRHPRFLLSREQFRETRTGRIFPVYDLSMSGLSVKVDQKFWEPGNIIQGILNLHPDSIELTPRLVGYYGDRAALKLEVASTYSRSVLARALSAKRLGGSLQLVREKLPLADYWYHGVCNTDLLLLLNAQGDISKVEVFFSNFYWSWSETTEKMATGVCQSFGKEQREDILLAEEPVKIEAIDLCLDAKADSEKTQWAKGILEAAPIEPRLKEILLKKFENPA